MVISMNLLNAQLHQTPLRLDLIPGTCLTLSLRDSVDKKVDITNYKERATG